MSRVCMTLGVSVALRCPASYAEAIALRVCVCLALVPWVVSELPGMNEWALWETRQLD